MTQSKQDEKRWPPRLFAKHHKISNGENFWTAQENGRGYDTEYISLEEHTAALARRDEALKIADEVLCTVSRFEDILATHYSIIVREARARIREALR